MVLLLFRPSMRRRRKGLVALCAAVHVIIICVLLPRRVRSKTRCPERRQDHALSASIQEQMYKMWKKNLKKKKISTSSTAGFTRLARIYVSPLLPDRKRAENNKPRSSICGPFVRARWRLPFNSCLHLPAHTRTSIYVIM